MKRSTIFLSIVAFFLITGSVLAMESTNYRLDWFTPLTGSGGPASSTNYAANFTVGQAVIGAPGSANYSAGLGYWYGITQATQHYIYLPTILRNAG